MRAIAKGSEPHSLTQYRLTAHAHYEGYAQKDELRLSLSTEQGGICCYCIQRIRPAIGGMKIEHWHCHDLHPCEQLDYRNLLGACMGNEGQPQSKQHCDTYKGNKSLSRNPADPAHRIEDFVRYLSNGRVESHDDQFNRELNVVLNLNHPLLVNNRKAVLDSFIRSLPPQTLGRLAWQRKLNHWNGINGSELHEYCGVVIYWLRKRLARA
jgi:uncharacterized protein (TIGR02646 family)